MKNFLNTFVSTFFNSSILIFREFENAIRNYDGDDPLENWYNFISWVEQSYPKQGHEGNLIPLLEDCLGKFELDKRYEHDPRLCKLFIKYVSFKI